MHKDVSRWRRGVRDDAARVAHSADTTSWRRDIADVVFGPDDQAELLHAIREGASLPQAAKGIGIAWQAVYGRAKWDADFSDALEKTLDETCPAGDYCGGTAGVKYGGHCRACRDAHTH